MVRLGGAAGPLFAELQNADSRRSLLMEVKIIGCSAINWSCPTDSRLQNIAGPGTACQEKGNARGKKGPVRRVFTGVLSLIREEKTPSRTRIIVLFFRNPNPNPGLNPNPNHIF